MLECEKTVIGQDRGIRVPEHAEKTALVLRVNIPRLEVVDARSRKVFGVVRRGHKK
jgi:hypothetical protein